MRDELSIRKRGQAIQKPTNQQGFQEITQSPIRQQTEHPNLFPETAL